MNDLVKWMDTHGWHNYQPGNSYIKTNGKLFVLCDGTQWFASRTPDQSERWAEGWASMEPALKFAESKMKPRTSTAVKRRYNDKTYDRLIADLRKEFVAEVREWAAAHNESIAGMIKAALTDYMKSRD